MKLAIADPPYLPGPGGRKRASIYYGPPSALRTFGNGNRSPGLSTGDHHPEAAQWNEPGPHIAMVERLVEEFDGWAIAMMPNNLADYLQWVPRDTRVCVWQKIRPVPTKNRVTTAWEPVLVYIPRGRRLTAPGTTMHDVMTSEPGGGFVGAKPRAWTRWVLDMMGYQDGDEVVDLFPGSGAVAAEVAQGVLL